MGISIVRYSDSSDVQRWGILNTQGLHPLNIEAAHHRELIDHFYADRKLFEQAVAGETIDISNVTYHSPINNDVQLIAQGLNYSSHRAESGATINSEEEENLIFLKAGSSVCDPNETIIRPKSCELLDYEIEMGIVLRKNIDSAVHVTDDNLGDYVAGLVLCNDVSARDFMFGAPMLQWYKGKSQRTFCPTGPVLYLLEAQDISAIYSLELKLWMNGELKQHATTDQLIHKPPKTITELSEFTNMKVGDVILTGTPGGVLANSSVKSAMAILLNFTNDHKRRSKFVSAQKAIATFLKPGDKLELEIRSPDGAIDLGRQVNQIADAI